MSKINPCAITGSAAKFQSRFELAKLQPVELDDTNENDVRIVAGDTNASRWDRPKFKDELVAEWNAANPAK